MEFVLTGFRQDRSMRHYAFESVSAERKREACSVCADLSLLHKHKIPLQEVPLLCRRLLEGAEPGARQKLVFSEAEMLRYTISRAAKLEAGMQRKRHRPPVSSRVGLAWRGTPPEQK